MDRLIKKVMCKALIAIIFWSICSVLGLCFGIYFFVERKVYIGIALIAVFLLGFYLPIRIFCGVGQYFPYNNFEEYKMKLSAKEDRFLQYGVKEDNTLTIFIEENDGVWTTKFADKTLKFALKHYFFPKAYLCAYFIRQLYFLEINKKQLNFLEFVGKIGLVYIFKMR